MAKKKYDMSDLEGLEKLFNDAVEEMAHEIVWKIENIYETAIDKFYADYNPLYYDRTYSTYLASSGYDNLFTPRNVYGNGHYWTAQIMINSNYIPGNPYHAKNKDWVFNRTFSGGIHGINTGKQWGTNSKVRKYQRIKGKKVFEAIWMNNSGITQRKKYYSGNIQIQDRELSNMIPPPKSLVGKEFKALTRKKNMKKIFDNIMNEKLSN